MPVPAALVEFNAAVAQCDSLIVNAHGVEANGAHILPEIDRRQITVAAFLNMYIAWETFLETAFAALLSGSPTIGGGMPAKFASPPTPDDALKMVIGVQRYFDYGNPTYFRRMAEIYFDQGVPFQPHINAIQGKLDDMRTMRHASAHVTSTTQAGLEALALRLLGQPSPGIDVYGLLTAVDPNAAGGATIFQSNRDVLVATATLIANG
jgi:hypothetical protein